MIEIGRLAMLYRFVVLLVIMVVSVQAAETYHVRLDAPEGGDGKSPATAFRSIQKAADMVKPGDTVEIGSGVYFENVQLKSKGKPDNPITFKADRIEKGRVIISGAARDIRSGKVKWKLEDKALGLYSVDWQGDRPTRVLYSNTDLYPYKSLEFLKKFVSNVHPRNKDEMVGPQHGYFYDKKDNKIYVRLHPSGNYGDTDPNKHTMCVSGPLGGGLVGLDVSKPSQYNFGILGVGPAYVVVEGLTCEAPGSTGIYTEGSDVTVRDCWFYGCRSGVGGTAPYIRPDGFNYDKTANRIIVERCFWTQFPTYEDAIEVLSMGLHFWQRKDVNGGLPDALLNYEVGIASAMGKDWTVRHNHVWSAFEALSSRATTNSDNARIYENLFERLVDNAVESEDHATNMHVYRNVIIDCFSPLSWQPLGDEPWPGPVFMYQNIIYNHKKHADVFAFRNPCIFKIASTNSRRKYGKEYVPSVSEPGIVIANNTVFWPDGCLFWAAIWGNNPDKLKLYNNIICAEINMQPGIIKRAVGLDLVLKGNIFVELPKANYSAETITATDLLKLENVNEAKFVPMQGSPAIGKAVAVPGLYTKFKDVGALQSGDTWYPLQVGPKESADK